MGGVDQPENTKQKQRRWKETLSFVLCYFQSLTLVLHRALLSSGGRCLTCGAQTLVKQLWRQEATQATKTCCSCCHSSSWCWCWCWCCWCCCCSCSSSCWCCCWSSCFYFLGLKHSKGFLPLSAKFITRRWTWAQEIWEERHVPEFTVLLLWSQWRLCGGKWTTKGQKKDGFKQTVDLNGTRILRELSEYGGRNWRSSLGPFGPSPHSWRIWVHFKSRMRELKRLLIVWLQEEKKLQNERICWSWKLAEVRSQSWK